MQSIGAENLVADPCILGKEEIFSIIDKAYEHRNAIREQLEHTMPLVRKTVLNLFHDISESILHPRNK